MAGLGDFLGGFVKGAASYGANAIDDRRKMEMELQKTKLLAQLQLETEKEMAVFNDKLKSQQADKDFSSADFTDGNFIMRNQKGEEVGRRALTDDEKKAHQMSLDKDQVDIEAKKNDMSYKNRSLDLQSQQLGIEGMNAQTNRMRANTDAEQLDYSKKKDGVTTLDGKPVAKADYNNTMTELSKSGANPRVLANFQTAWNNGLDAGWSLKDQKEFLRRTRELWTNGGTTKNGKQIKPLLDRYSTSSLDAAIQANTDSGS